jgi:hypothetical protein
MSAGFLGLARALNAEGRERLRARLSAGISAEPARNRGELADTEGLIALARVGKNEKEALALKERFAAQNAVYLSEALASGRSGLHSIGTARKKCLRGAGGYGHTSS